MSGEENKAPVKRFYAEVWNGGKVDAVDDLFAPTYLRHEGSDSRSLPADTQKQFATLVRGMMRDLALDVEVLLAEGDLVAAYWRISGIDGRTGTSITNYTGVNIFRFQAGRVAEIWNVRDDLSRFQQLGVVPPTKRLLGGIPDRPSSH